MTIDIKTVLCYFFMAISFSTCWAKDKIVILITAYNNKPWVIKTLDSVFSQEYRNFRVIYIDDASTDGSADIVQEYLSAHHCVPITYIRNEIRRRKLYNVYYAIHSCDPHEIIFMLDGDDRLAHTKVLSHIIKLYQNPDVWLTYGQDMPSSVNEALRWRVSTQGNCSPTPQHIIDHNAFRDHRFVYMHPRTFYAWLFKAIKLDDLLAQHIEGFQGEFYPVCNDYAMMYPMLEMAGKHILFNPDVLYVYNVENPSSGFKIARQLQIACSREVKKRNRYTPLAKPPL